MMATNKPSRSDEVLDAEDQMKIANEVRAQFDALAPKRPIKPNRSDPADPVDPITLSSPHILIPELHNFLSLQSHSQATLSPIDAVDHEFVETHYYKHLASIDKQHHATGTGFIKVASEGSEYGIQLPQNRVDVSESETKPRGYNSNPATNDWVPSFDDQAAQAFVSSKPNRSESS